LPTKDVGRLLLRCADRPGLVAAVSSFLASAGANIVSLDQHSTQQSGGTFMQRTIFHLPGLTAARDALERDFGEQVASRFDMDFRLTEAAKPKRVAILASKEDHCLLDLLWRNRRGELARLERLAARVAELQLGVAAEQAADLGMGVSSFVSGSAVPERARINHWRHRSPRRRLELKIWKNYRQPWSKKAELSSRDGCADLI
jgi:predicted amino acid-binding ACT domain protein